MFTGCSHSLKMTYSNLTATEQLLITRSVERAAEELNLEQFSGKKVFLEIHGITGNKDFVKDFLINQFEKKGITIVSEKSQAERIIKAFISSLGIDSSESLFGTPAFAMPFGFSIPEIAIYKSMRNKGYSEIKLFAYDYNSEKNAFLPESSPSGIGESLYNVYTFLLFFTYTNTDVYKK